ncbi:Rid family hydrolase [Nonomuraea sp. NPDC051941]|uniref:Rid family hydrolase n=1 Tax=Nonomuraea sp. NPDC051941 TaxID=3364373 RepID=UPI0037C58B5B
MRRNVSSGGPFEDVYGYNRAVRIADQVHVTDIADAELVARAHREVFGEVRPAATLVEVSGLLDPRMKVEIEVYAVEPN